jgi:hypothetical protein
MLSTKHNNSTITVRRRGTEIEKPQSVMNYNEVKGFIDLSDQLKAYAPSLRKGVKWYRKLAVELLTGTAVVNAFVMFQDVIKTKMCITIFKENSALKLLRIEETNPQKLPRDIDVNHILQKTEKRDISVQSTHFHRGHFLPNEVTENELNNNEPVASTSSSRSQTEHGESDSTEFIAADEQVDQDHDNNISFRSQPMLLESDSTQSSKGGLTPRQHIANCCLGVRPT